MKIKFVELSAVVLSFFLSAAIQARAQTQSLIGHESVGVPTQLYPAEFDQIIELQLDKATLKTGVLAKGEAVFSVPYSYRRVVRAEENIHVKGDWLVQRLAVEKGAMGFVGLDYTTNLGSPLPNRTLCFFSPAYGGAYAKNMYGTPWCFLEMSHADGTSDLDSVQQYGNIPIVGFLQFHDGSRVARPVETPNLKIDHEFRLELVVTQMLHGKLFYEWRSDGVAIGITKKLDNGSPMTGVVYAYNGMAQIPFHHGSLFIRPTGLINHFQVEYIENLSALPSGNVVGEPPHQPDHVVEIPLVP